MSRIFAALLLPEEIELHLSEHVDALRTARPDLRWIKPQRWHLTLQYLGECGPHEVDRQLDRWQQRAQRSGPMDLHLRGAGAFPAPYGGRVLWAGLGGDLGAWRLLAAPDQEPHVTIARTRSGPADLVGPVGELASYVGPSWRPDELAIVESHIRAAGERGPRYQPIERFALGHVGAD